VRRIVSALLLFALLAASVAARAEWSVNAQLERYQWKERTSPEVKITGWQPGIGVTWLQDKEAGFHFRYRGELYAGSFKYVGALQDGTPVQDTIDYSGLVNELHGLYRPSAESPFELVAGVGLDYWQRRLPFAGAGTAASGRQQEDWTVLFLRAGLEAGWRTRPGWFGGAGLKYTLGSRVNSHLMDIGFDQNPEVNPGRELSFYADAGYRLNRNWRATAYYESYRFSRSPGVLATSGSSTFVVTQPRSTQDDVGLRLEYVF
jgi:opacity protein-like surface antigen